MVGGVVPSCGPAGGSGRAPARGYDPPGARLGGAAPGAGPAGSLSGGTAREGEAIAPVRGRSGCGGNSGNPSRGLVSPLVRSLAPHAAPGCSPGAGPVWVARRVCRAELRALMGDAGVSRGDGRQGGDRAAAGRLANRLASPHSVAGPNYYPYGCGAGTPAYHWLGWGVDL